jgi:exodeoxyribonuclease III
LDDAVRIATVNVNGLRAAFRRGMASWIAECHPDVLLLQEVRAPDAVVGELLPAPAWHVAHAEASLKGRSGVAIASRVPLTDVRIGLDVGVPTNTGRWIEADLDIPGVGAVTVVSVYVHSGIADHPSMDEKYAFLGSATERMARLLASGGHVLVGGDLNITRTDADLKNWRGNVGHAGCLPDERAWLARWFDAGWVDVGRALAGDVPGPYTWWSWRGKAFDNDAGWRIDYQVATPRLADLARGARVDRAPSYAERFSDHAPLVVDYGIQPLP